MNLTENIKEGLRSVRANLLRSVITAFIVTLGITALVGVLTAVDGIQASIKKSLSSLGANTFYISSRYNRGNSSQGVQEKNYPKVTMGEVLKFVDQYQVPSAVVGIMANVTQIAEV